MKKIAAALLSGILLFCSFPPLEYYAFAWLALIPLIYLCFCSKPGKSFLYGLLTGAVFWLASIFWLTSVSFIGWFFISLYCACYFACFALIVSWWHNFTQWNFKTTRQQSAAATCSRLTPLRRLNLIFLFGAPAIWVGLEYGRAQFLTGFPWNLIGVSQYACHPLIQCAQWGGVYLVSYLIIMGNTAFALLIYDYRSNFKTPGRIGQTGLASYNLSGNHIMVGARPRPRDGLYREGILRTGAILAPFLLIIFLVSGYGKWRLDRSSEQLETIRAAAVQLNVPQQYKWSDEWANDIYRRLQKSTVAVCKTAPPDLIVWPETALPDFMRYCELSREVVNETLRYGIPLLIGSMDYEILPGKTNYYNSSFFFLPGGHAAQVYEKRHLVVFGEYVPLARYFPFLRSITGIEEDFTPGTKNIVFRLNGRGTAFSVLICFEDTLPYLARECVRAGARLLINQTNDAWFDPYWASRQHMAHCVFRCVENRVACLRSTNTGLTCYIDRLGLIRSSLEPQGRKQRAPQVMRSEVNFSPENMPLTFYTRHGDLFALACAAFSLPLFVGALLSFLRKRP